MRAPSIKILVDRLSISEEQAAQVRGIIKGDIDPETFPNTKSWAEQCVNPLAESELQLSAINEIIDGYGCEPLWGISFIWPDFDYINMGDSYAPTIIAERDGRYIIRWHVGCMADFVGLTND